MRRAVTIILALLPALLAAAVARADTTTSSNWAGYAIHRSGVSFHQASGSWRAPSADCAAAAPAYSAAWVGIGGYALNSPALEQIGTETDCTRHGRVRVSAWYELVPVPSHTLALRIRPGDRVSATVTVVGHRVTLALRDRTRHRSVVKSVTVRTIDISSAEWIVEAPSQCASSTRCRTLPLADFGAVGFTGARARDARGHSGPIASRRWNRTRIRLTSATPKLLSTGAAVFHAAVPSRLAPSGAGFDVAFRASRPVSIPRPPVPIANLAGVARILPGDRRP